ncbi:MAG: MarR family winged helix-turn-helix transcriptional regulator [Candidatus Promineifilaceae bacterium]
MTNLIGVYDLLKEVFLIIEDGDRTFFQQYDLTVTRFYALYHLDVSPGMTLRGLADRMLCDKSNVTRVVKGLERDKLIYRQDHETDGRAYRLYLHEAGRVLLKQVNKLHAAYNLARFDNDLSTSEYSQLEQTLLKLKDELTAKL